MNGTSAGRKGFGANRRNLMFMRVKLIYTDSNIKDIKERKIVGKKKGKRCKINARRKAEVERLRFGTTEGDLTPPIRAFPEVDGW